MPRRKGFIPKESEQGQNKGRINVRGSRIRTAKNLSTVALSEPMAAQVHDYLKGRPQGALIREIIDDCAVPRREQKELKVQLEMLIAAGLISCDRHKRYALSDKKPYIEATLSIHPKGFAFASPVDGSGARAEDFFVPPGEFGGARHGDQVLLRVSENEKGRTEAAVVGIVARSRKPIVGIFTSGRDEGLVQPEEDCYPFAILVRKEHSLDAKNGQAVLAELAEGGNEEGLNPPGRVIRILGDPEDLQTQTEMAIHKFELPSVFSAAAVSEAKALDGRVTVTPDREDLRPISHVTIDGETARDFDDAVALTELSSGYRLYVSIADVSHYVQPGSPLDHEAFARGTSVYFPNRVLPMLPERISNDLCSLVPRQDRYAFTAILDFDLKGKVVATRFTKSVITSRHRLTYTVVRAVLEDGATLPGDDGLVTDMLHQMGILAAILEKRRLGRGSIGFEIPEPWVKLSEDGKILAVDRSSRNRAHKLIEEFMLVANEAVAEAWARATKIQGRSPFLFRIHEAPDPLKVAEFTTFAQSLGLRLPKESTKPAWFGRVLSLVAGTPKEYIINNIMLRVMKQACYSPKNSGHFGLAASFYSHFTSPIRRYPDLMAHRALLEIITRAKGDKPTKGGMSPEELGLFLSKRERTAIDAERDMAERIKVRFMADKIGEVFDGIISGVANFGLFVELLESFVSGVVAITDLPADFYHHEEKTHRLVGSRQNRVYQVGDLISVKVAHVDQRRRRISFLPAGPTAGS